MNNEYLQIINKATFCAFDEFATSVQADAITAIHQPNQHLNMCADSLCQRTVNQWASLGLINVQPDTPWSVADVALATILSVLKKRGLNIKALRQITEYLNMSMYQGLSGLEFLVLYCQWLNHAPVLSGHVSPLLVVDGDNRVFVAIPSDLATIWAHNPCKTYSLLTLNVRKILSKCDFIYKIMHSTAAEMLEIPTQITERFFDPSVQHLDINIPSQRMQITTCGGDAPLYGERTVKYQDGRVVADIVKATEVLNA